MSSKLKTSLIWLIITLIIYVIFYNFLDLRIDIWAKQTFSNTNFASICWDYGGILTPKHWLAISLVALVLGIRAKRKQYRGARALLLFSISLLGAYIVCAVLKIGLARYRPIEYFQHGLYGFHFFSNKHAFMSTPSGHATMAFAGLFALSKIIKRTWATVILLLLATATVVSRIVITAHYPSDVILGAYIGMLGVYWTQSFVNILLPHAASTATGEASPNTHQ